MGENLRPLEKSLSSGGCPDTGLRKDLCQMPHPPGVIQMDVGKENPRGIRKIQPGELLFELLHHRCRTGIHEVTAPPRFHQHPGREIPPKALVVHGKIQMVKPFSGNLTEKDPFFGMIHMGFHG
jgi:hypothetical protein